MRTKDLPEELRKAFEELEELSKDPAMRVIALNREIELRDQLQRLSDAIEKGRDEGREEVKISGLNVGTASRIDGLEFGRIRRLLRD